MVAQDKDLVLTAPSNTKHLSLFKTMITFTTKIYQTRGVKKSLKTFLLRWLKILIFSNRALQVELFGGVEFKQQLFLETLEVCIAK